MKKSITFLFFLVALSCSKDSIKPQMGSVSFGMTSISHGLNGGRISSLVPASILLSITDNNGNPIIQNKRLNMVSFGQGYLSESLELLEGTYKLTQFVILNANDTVIYATPMEGSSMAQYVVDPLPINFTITKNESTQVVPQVLEVKPIDAPESFGYASFGFEIVHSKFRSIRFELYTDQNYSNDTHTIIFKPRIFGKFQCFNPWDSTFAPMLIKDIPNESNKIVFEKFIPYCDTMLAGFDYQIINVGYSWYNELVLPNEEYKIIAFDFK